MTRTSLFIVTCVVGAVPLLLSSALLLWGVPHAGRIEELMEPVAVAGGVLVLLAVVASLGASAAMRQQLGHLRRAINGILGDGDRTWITRRGSTREVQDLGFALNRAAGCVREQVQELRSDEAESHELTTQSLELIEELLKARIPEAKHHPGLIEDFSRELAKRKIGPHHPIDENAFVKGLLETVAVKKDRDRVRRAYPRYTMETLNIDAPVPARVTNLSASGMCLESLYSPQGDKNGIFRLVSSSGRFEIEGTVRWCKLVRTLKGSSGESLPVYRAGIAFAREIPASVRERLIRTLESEVQAL